MDSYSVLGEGGFAVVMGPFTYKDLNALDLFHKRFQRTTQVFIIKIHKKLPKYSNQKLVQKQALYTRLTERSKHNSILFPLAMSLVLGNTIIRMFPYMKQFLDPGYFYQLELEEYGGADVDAIIYSKEKPNFSMKQFMTIWGCVPNILEDSYRILFDNDLIMTDVKSENMVLSSDYILRLIDVDINPNKKLLRINTNHIQNLPPQYFSREWWDPYDQDKRISSLQRYKKATEKVLRYEKDTIHSILGFIHKDKDPSFFIRQQQTLPRQENQSQRLFFVMYPLLMTILKMIVYQCVRPKTAAEKDQIKRIMVFCLSVLRKRGHFHGSFQHFLRQMKQL